jgi:hypothetical protein
VEHLEQQHAQAKKKTEIGTSVGGMGRVVQGCTVGVGVGFSLLSEDCGKGGRSSGLLVLAHLNMSALWS